ncbi:phage tail protein [Chromobacterium subtsugae]|uniref:phage tail protein n=1 Tax=Chromobacterium subtsugae TaxID=251747 RepID=UPI0009BBAC23|nr:phage tail protein [Chromobacterium subtsugae]
MQEPMKPINSADVLFHDGNPYTGELGTIVTSDWLNGAQAAIQSSQQELLSVIKSSGQKADPARQDQLLQAVQSIAWGSAQRPSTLAGYGISDGASKTDLKAAIDGVVAGAPGALNTLQELAAALGNDQNFAASIAKLLAGKADKATTLAGYGITDGVSSAQANMVAPAGQIAFFAMSQAPAGWLAANGMAVSRKDYAPLFAAIGTQYGAGDGGGTFNLPDLRGEFIRAWDDSGKIDPDSPKRKVGDRQPQQTAAHKHVMPWGESTAINTSPFGCTANIGKWGSGSSDSDNRWYHSNDGSDYDGMVNPPGVIGAETRPHNVALLACIKC